MMSNPNPFAEQHPIISIFSILRQITLPCSLLTLEALNETEVHGSVQPNKSGMGLIILVHYYDFFQFNMKTINLYT